MAAWKKQDYSKFPDSDVFLRDLKRSLPIIARGEGVFLYDRAGKRYFDASSGAFVVSVGHGNREVLSEITDRTSRISYVNGIHFGSEASEELACNLAQKGKIIGLDCAYFLNSGSEAVEAAVKLARQIAVERGEAQRTRLIARTPSYHGNTLFALSLSSRPHYKRLYGPLLHGVTTVAAPYRYRSPVEDYDVNGAKFFVDLLEHEIITLGPKTVLALILEPVIGSSAAGALPPDGYLKEVERICRKYGVLLIADEVLCGSGRTGKFFACEHFGFKPDILVLGKGLNGGYAPLSAVMTQKSMVKEIQAGTGYFVHAQTYAHVPCAASAGLAVMNYMDRHNILDEGRAQGKELHRKLQEDILLLDHIGHIDGTGLLAGIEFVADKKTKAPFDRNGKVAERFMEHALSLGLVVWPNVGHVDGLLGDLVMLAPPLTLMTQELNEMVSLFKKVVLSFQFKK